MQFYGYQFNACRYLNMWWRVWGNRHEDIIECKQSYMDWTRYISIYSLVGDKKNIDLVVNFGQILHWSFEQAGFNY